MVYGVFLKNTKNNNTCGGFFVFLFCFVFLFVCLFVAVFCVCVCVDFFICSAQTGIDLRPNENRLIE